MAHDNECVGKWKKWESATHSPVTGVASGGFVCVAIAHVAGAQPFTVELLCQSHFDHHKSAGEWVGVVHAKRRRVH